METASLYSLRRIEPFVSWHFEFGVYIRHGVRAGDAVTMHEIVRLDKSTAAREDERETLS